MDRTLDGIDKSMLPNSKMTEIGQKLKGFRDSANR